MTSLVSCNLFPTVPTTCLLYTSTAFLYKNKCYHHKVVPFGLSTSLAAIVKCLERTLGLEVEPYR